MIQDYFVPPQYYPTTYIIPTVTVSSTSMYYLNHKEDQVSKFEQAFKVASKLVESGRVKLAKVEEFLALVKELEDVL